MTKKPLKPEPKPTPNERTPKAHDDSPVVVDVLRDQVIDDGHGNKHIADVVLTQPRYSATLTGITHEAAVCACCGHPKSGICAVCGN